MSATEKKTNELVDIIARLRGPDGCPWDQRQTPQSMKKYLLEESHELLEAIDSEDTPHIKEELGDLLFQILFIVNIYEDDKKFSLSDVIDTISQKMIRRHPHVFGDSDVTCEKELRKHWDKIKAAEKNNKDICLLSSIPKSLPALRRAQRVSERAARRGFDWPDQSWVVKKLDEEINELHEAMANGDQKAIEEEIGDTIFTLVNISRLAGIVAEEALQKTTEKFIHRFSKLEEHIAGSNKEITDLSIQELINIWNATKMN
jgi:MazG family protein